MAELLALDDDRAHGFVGMASEIPRAALRKVDILKFLKSQLATELTIENHCRDGFEEIFGNPPRCCARKTFSKVSTSVIFYSKWSSELTFENFPARCCAWNIYIFIHIYV